MLTLVYLIIVKQDVPAISGHRCVADFSQSEGTVMLDGHLFPSIFLMERERKRSDLTYNVITTYM